MGDRANVVVKADDTAPLLYLYTHWNGTGLIHDVQIALKRKLRWEDPAYLTRIIFDQMVGDQQGEETGYGISTDICDNEHRWIVLDCVKQQVLICERHTEAWFKYWKGGGTGDYPENCFDHRPPLDKIIHAISFEMFIELSPEKLDELYLEQDEDDEQSDRPQPLSHVERLCEDQSSEEPD